MPDLLGLFCNSRRREIPWEVVDSRSVEPVPMYYDDEDLDIVSIGQAHTRGTYVFDVKLLQKSTEFRNALLFSRQQLLEVVAQKGFNSLLLESWTLTLLRKGKQHRVQVEYGGRPVQLVGKLPPPRPPPFMALLDSCRAS